MPPNNSPVNPMQKFIWFGEGEGLCQNILPDMPFVRRTRGSHNRNLPMERVAHCLRGQSQTKMHETHADSTASICHPKNW